MSIIGSQRLARICSGSSTTLVSPLHCPALDTRTAYETFVPVMGYGLLLVSRATFQSLHNRCLHGLCYTHTHIHVPLKGDFSMSSFVSNNTWGSFDIGTQTSVVYPYLGGGRNQGVGGSHSLFKKGHDIIITFANSGIMGAVKKRCVKSF